MAGSSPFQLAVGIGAAMLSLTLMAALVRAVLAGSPGGIAKAVGRDLPAAVFTMLATILFTQVALDLTDEISNWVWAGTRDDAARALEAISQILAAGMPASHFLGIVVAVGLLLSMLFLWVVLFVRESLIYLVIVFSAAFAWPMMVFPPLRDTAKKAGELLLALIICKPVITLALSVGVSALAGIGGTGTPGDGAGTNLAREVGTLVVGVITFGLAAFMPFLCWKLMPLVAAAVVAQGVASAPMRAAQSGMQLQYYTTSTMQRLASGGRVPGVQRRHHRHTAGRTAALGPGPAATSAAAATAGAPVAAVAAPAVATARTVSARRPARRSTGQPNTAQADNRRRLPPVRWGTERWSRNRLAPTASRNCAGPACSAPCHGRCSSRRRPALGIGWLAVAGFVPWPIAAPVAAGGLFVAVGSSPGPAVARAVAGAGPVLVAQAAQPPPLVPSGPADRRRRRADERARRPGRARPLRGRRHLAAHRAAPHPSASSTTARPHGVGGGAGQR